MSAFLKRTVLLAALALPLGFYGAQPCLAQYESDASDGREPIEPSMDEYKTAVPLADQIGEHSEPAEPQEQAEAPAPEAEAVAEAQPEPEPEPMPLKAVKKGKKQRAERKSNLAGVTSDVKVDAGPVENADAKARKVQEAMTHLAYGTVPTPASDAYASFAGTITFEGVEDITSPRDGRLVITISSGEWVAEGDMIGFVTSPELAAIMAYTPQGQRLTAAQRWKQVYGAEVIKAARKSLVVQIYRRDKSIVKKGDLLFSLADEAYLIGTSAGRPNEAFSPGMRAEMRLRGVPGSPVIPGILQEFYRAAATGSNDPLAGELGETGSQPYALRFQIPARAAALVKPGAVYDGYITMRNTPNGPVVPARALLNKDGRTYLVTLSEVSVMAQTNNTVQLDVAPWPGTAYIYPESIAGYAVKHQQSGQKPAAQAKTASPAKQPPVKTGKTSAEEASAAPTEAEVVSVQVTASGDNAASEPAKKAAITDKAAKAKAAKKPGKSPKAAKAAKAKAAKAKAVKANAAKAKAAAVATPKKQALPPEDFSGGLEPMALPPATTGAAPVK